MKTPARVTQRCLSQDLTDDWDDTGDQRLARGEGIASPKAVHLLKHKLIQKAVDDFPISGDIDKKRESITGLTRPPFWKVKTDRWRGAVYVDSEGQAWLVAAGRRYEGEAKDFYKRFMADVESRGAEFFLPSAADLKLYEDELSLRRLEEREHRVKGMSVDLLARALDSADHYASAELVLDPSSDEPRVLARLELIVEVPEKSDPQPFSVLIEVSEIDWEYYDLFVWDEQVILAAICPQEDRWGTTQTDVRIHSVDVPTRDELDAMARGDVARDPLGHFAAGEFAHTVHRARLTQCTVEGEPVQGVCGRWFVPRQDHESKEQCATCLTIIQTLKIRLGTAKESDHD